MFAASRFLKRLSLLFRRNRFRSELDEEMAFHREQTEQELRASGLSPDAAHTVAMRRFGNPAHLREQSHRTIAFRAETILQDLRFALRQLRKNPGFAVTAILILALGIGVSVAIFSFVDAALIQPLPYAHPDRLVAVDETAPSFPRSNLSYDDWLDYRLANTTLSSLDVYGGTGFLLHIGSVTMPVPARRVSAGFFRTLGVKPMLGRDFLPGEDRPGGARIAILPYGTWIKRFDGRTDVVGKTVSLSGDAYTIVGVLPRQFVFAPARDSEFYVPLLDRNGCEKRRSCHNLDGVARLREGVTVARARADLQRIAAQLALRYPASNRGQGAFVAPLADLIVGEVRPILLTLLAGAGLLLLIACVNVSSLVLVRSESRRREVAVRGALGASRARLLRLFVTEGLLLSAGGSAAGIAIAAGLMAVLRQAAPQSMLLRLPFIQAVGLNAHAAWFALAAALAAATLLTATPVLRLSFVDLHSTLGEGGRASAGRFWQRLGANLVVVELTVAVVLLAGAGLLGKSFYKLLHVETGFDTHHLATVNVMERDKDYPTAKQQNALYAEIERSLRSLPGVESLGLTTNLPIQCNCDTDWIRFVGKPFHGEHNEVLEREVSSDYLPTLKTRLVRGRMLSPEDGLGGPQVMLINQALARKYFPGEDPIDKVVGEDDLAPDSLRTIVGVVADVREGALDAEMWPAEYRTLAQNPSSYFSVVVRTAGDASSLLPPLVKRLRAIDPNLGVYGEDTMQHEADSSQAALLHQLSMSLVGGFAAIALLLSIVGLYGVVAYSVSQRTREIGVRMALGAQRGTIYSMVMRQAGLLTGIGIAVGLTCSIGAALAMRSLLFGVAAWDAPTLAAVALVLAGASLAASFLPARRAASVNPTDALRAE
ncbi:MAG TPA: ABC transporter permease [Terracidiphilus sp.]|nr:ABC transporter permease [Terracidiphilus sp.]